MMFSCRSRGFCPSCHAKRLAEWGEWMRETLLLDVPHRQVIFTVPKRLRPLGEMCRAALRALTCYFELVAGGKRTSGVIAAIQTFGDRINFHPPLHFLLTEGGVDRGASSISSPGSTTRGSRRSSAARSWPCLSARSCRARSGLSGFYPGDILGMRPHEAALR